MKNKLVTEENFIARNNNKEIEKISNKEEYQELENLTLYRKIKDANVPKSENNNNQCSYIVQCEDFGHQFCSKCLEPPHPGKSCNIDINNHFFKWIEESRRNLKTCPNCTIWTEKLLGCNHIKCSQCSHEWCWLCGMKYTITHYNDINSKCLNKMYDGQNVEFLFNNPPQEILQRQRFGDDIIMVGPPAEENEEPNLKDIYTIGFWYFKAKIPYYTSLLYRILYAIVIIFISVLVNIPIIVLSLNCFKAFGLDDIKIKDPKIELLSKIMNLVSITLKVIAIPSIGLLITGLIYLPHLLVYIFTLENV